MSSLLSWQFIGSWQIIGLILGMGVGFNIIWFDRIFYVWYEGNPELTEGEKLLENRKYTEFFSWLRSHHLNFSGLIMDSFLFLIILWLLSLFLITTTQNAFGVGVTIGLLTERTWNLFKHYPNWSKIARLLSVNGKISDQEAKIFTYITGVWLLALIIILGV